MNMLNVLINKSNKYLFSPKKIIWDLTHKNRVGPKKNPFGPKEVWPIKNNRL
jgi:hypothetical protein